MGKVSFFGRLSSFSEFVFEQAKGLDAISRFLTNHLFEYGEGLIAIGEVLSSKVVHGPRFDDVGLCDGGTEAKEGVVPLRHAGVLSGEQDPPHDQLVRVADQYD